MNRLFSPHILFSDCIFWTLTLFLEGWFGDLRRITLPVKWFLVLPGRSPAHWQAVGQASHLLYYHGGANRGLPPRCERCGAHLHRAGKRVLHCVSGASLLLLPGYCPLPATDKEPRKGVGGCCAGCRGGALLPRHPYPSARGGALQQRRPRRLARSGAS